MYDKGVFTTQPSIQLPMPVATYGDFYTFQLFNIAKVNFSFQKEDKYKDVTIALAVIGGILLVINVFLIAGGW